MPFQFRKKRTLVFLPMLLLVLPVGLAFAQDSLVGHEEITYGFPDSFAVEKKWDEFQRDANKLSDAQSLLELDSPCEYILPWGDTTFSSAWGATNRWLGQNPEVLAELRTSQNRKARTALYLAGRSGDPGALSPHAPAIAFTK